MVNTEKISPKENHNEFIINNKLKLKAQQRFKIKREKLKKLL